MTHWILPWRTTVFNLPQCLYEYGFVEWRQINKLSVGDIVFLYCTKPVAQILFMFRVSKINIPYSETINKKYLFDTYNYHLQPTDYYARLEPIAEASENNFELSYYRLTQLGFTSRLQQGVKVNEPLLSHLLNNFDVIFDSATNAYTEGEAHKVLVTSYERNPIARKKCISKFGYVCQICGMDFKKVYGKIGNNFIHVHHIDFIANKGGTSHEVNPETDLIPVCPNCHAMLHRKVNGSYLTPNQLKNCLLEV